MKLTIADIIIPEGRRVINESKVADLAQSIKMIGGLLAPIIVREDMTLIAGAHRLKACKRLGFDQIDGMIFDSNDLETELVEIDENLIRHELHYIERGKLAIRRNEILEALGLRAKVGQGRPTKNGADSAPFSEPLQNKDETEKVDKSCGDPEPPRGKAGGQKRKDRQGTKNNREQTTADLAKEIGMSERTLQEEMRLARHLVPEAQKVVQSLDIPKKDARDLARLTPAEQQEVITKCERGEIIQAVRQKVREKEWEESGKHKKGCGLPGRDGKIRPAKYQPRKKTVATTEFFETEQYVILKMEGEKPVIVSLPLPKDAIEAFNHVAMAMGLLQNVEKRRSMLKALENFAQELESLAMQVGLLSD